MGTHDFSQFSVVLRRRAKQVQDIGPEIIRRVGQAGLNTIVTHTPVDTTKAVSNWRVGAIPPGGTVGPKVAGSVKGSGASAARGAVRADAARFFAGFKGGVAYIVNRVPYIGVLEYGDIRHRPSGMVAKGLQAMTLAAKSIRIFKS